MCLIFSLSIFKIKHSLLWGHPFLLFPVTIFLLINNLPQTVGSVSVYNILVLLSWDYFKVTLVRFGCEMINHTLILVLISLVLKRSFLSPHLWVLEGHLTVVSMKYLSIHEDSLCWPAVVHAQVIVYRVGSFSFSIESSVPAVRKYKRGWGRTEQELNVINAILRVFELQFQFGNITWFIAIRFVILDCIPMCCIFRKLQLILLPHSQQQKRERRRSQAHT